ncbi:hypothetical protein L1887_61419 [Cichorium endivia]|nr:hypothetical protein L1887_61419 [Cichorium endivia]
MSCLEVLLAVCGRELGVDGGLCVRDFGALLGPVEVVQQREGEDLLSDLGQVDTQRLVLFRRTEVAAGNAVDGEQQDQREHKAPAETRCRVGELVAELDPVVVDPSTGNGRRAVERRHAVVGEEGSKNVANHTADTVCRKDVERIVVAEQVLEARGKVAGGTADDTEGNGSGSAHVTGSGRDGHETRDGAGAEADGGPLALEPPVPEHPGECTDRRGDLGDHHGLHGTQVGAERRAAVEAEPAEPEEDGAEDAVADVVRAVRQLLRAVTLALAQEDRDGERSRAGRDVHGRTTSKVKTTHHVGPAKTDVPGPVGDRVVDDRRPAERKDHHGPQARTVGKRTARDDHRDGGEHHLVDAVQQLRQHRASGRGTNVHAHQTKVVQTYADELVGRGWREGEREAPEEPFERDDGHQAHGHPQHRQRRLFTQQTRVEESNAGDHDEHERRRHDDPRHVAEIVDDVRRLAGDDGVGEDVAIRHVGCVDHLGLD